MRTHITFWVIWLLMWAASGSHASVCSQVAGQVTVQITTQGSVGTCQQASSNSQQATCGGQAGTTTSTTIRTVHAQQGAPTLALHDLVYKSDLAGLREKMKVLTQAEHHPTLIGALQSTDDKGLTITHLLACAGRFEELFLVTQAVQKLYEGLAPLPAKVFKRASLESLSYNASCSTCRPDRTQYEVVPHLRLELTNPKQTIFLYGNVTPLECAAAHGHVDAMKLLMQRGVQPGRALIVAQHFGLENQLIEAVGQAKAQGGLGVELHPDLPNKVDTPLRKPRQRRTDKSKAKNKSKSESGSSSNSSSKQKAATATAQHQHQNSCNSCSPRPPSLTITPQPGVQRPGGPPSVIGTVSTSILGVRGKDQDPSKPVSTPTQLSEAMDVAALWLLSIMLFFPAWSTFCLLWRKMIKRRWALQESVARVRRTVCAVAKPFKRDSSATAAAAVAAAVPSAAAPSAGSGTQRSAASGPDSKGTKDGTATPRQQRKPGPSIALPGSGLDPKAPAMASSPTGSLCKAVSAPEASFHAQLDRVHNATEGSQSAAGHIGGLHRQTSSVAAVVASASIAPVLAKLAKAAAPAGAQLLPLQRQSSNAGTAGRAADKGTAVAGGSSSTASAAGAATASAAAGVPATPTCSAAAGKLKRNKHGATAAAVAASPTHAKEDGKASSSRHSKADTSTSSAVSNNNSHSSSAGGSAGKESAKPALKQPQVLHKASKAEQHPDAAITSAKASSSSTSGSTKAVADGSKADSHNSIPRAVSALSAALKPGRISPSPGALEIGSPTGSSGKGSGVHGGLGRRSSGAFLGSPPGRALHTMLSPGGSGRFTVAAAAAAAAAVRDAAAASLAATASLRRTASGGVAPSPRSPLQDADDVLSRCRDQDRPHGTPAASGGGVHDMASSAQSGNAWTPAAAAARAARAAGPSDKPPREGEADMDDAHSPRSGCGQQPAESAATRVGACAESATDLGAGGYSYDSSCAAAAATTDSREYAAGASAAAGVTAGPYVDSFTAAAVAAGILPSPTGTKPEAAAESHIAPLPKQGLPHADNSSFDAAEAAAATAYAAAVAALPSDADGEQVPFSCASTHSPQLDPPVSLLPRNLQARLGAAPGRTAFLPGVITRSVSALEPKMVQDLADLVAASIAQEVARHKHSGVDAQHAAETRASDPGSQQPSEDSAQAAAAGGAAELTGLMGSQLVHKTLDEVLTSALTASQHGAANAAGACIQEEGGQDFFSFSSADLFADLADKLKLPAKDSPHKPQQQLDAPVSAPLMHAGEQHVWFGSHASGPMPVGAHMQLSSAAAGGVQAGAHGNLSMNVPAIAALSGAPGLQGPPGLQMPPASAVSASLPAGVTMMPAQNFVPAMQQQVLGQPMQQQQVLAQPMQQQMVGQPMQQQHMMVQAMPQQQDLVTQQQPQLMGQQMAQPMHGMMVTMDPGQQQVQVVSMQPITAPGAQHTTRAIRLANGQLVQGQFVAVQGMHRAVPALAGPAPAGTPVILGAGGVVSMQQVQHMPQQQQCPQQMVAAQQVFYSQGGMVQQQVMTQQGPQVMTQQGPQYVTVQLPGGLLQIVPVQQGRVNAVHAAHGHVMHAMQRQQAPLTQRLVQGRPQPMLYRSHSKTAQLGSSPAQVTILTRPPGIAPASGLSCSPVKLTVLKAPAGPGSTPAIVVDPHRTSAEGAAAASGGSGGELQAAADQHSESAQMAADLEELLNQANEEMGWSSLPKAAEGSPSHSAGVAASPSSVS